MPSNVYWLDEPHIMVAEYSGSVSHEDIQSAMDQCLSVLSQHSCHFLVDTTQVTTLPKDLLRLGPVLTLINHSNRGWLIFLAHQNIMIKFAVQVMVRNKFRFMTSREEAVTFLTDIVKQVGEVSLS
ncbi:MAG: hypothetical protein K8J31_02315 [Anaerolineae bacterium]|nr:hypothetical protein [Anaerolineae bacterium]